MRPGQAALRASSTWPSRSAISITAASTGVGLFQCVQAQAGQRSRAFGPPSSSTLSRCSAVAQLGQKLCWWFIGGSVGDLRPAVSGRRFKADDLRQGRRRSTGTDRRDRRR